MSSKVARIAALAATLTVVGAMSAVTSASATDFKTKFFNWPVSGSVTPKLLNEPVVLPPQSSFTGEGDFKTLEPINGKLTGVVTVPPFTANLKLLGLVPTTVGVTFTQVGVPEGTAVGVPEKECASDPEWGCMHVNILAKANIGITVVGTLGINVPTKCETSEPIAFPLSETLIFSEIFAPGLHFTGKVTIPPITCTGPEGLALGLALTAVMSGTENPFELNIVGIV